MKKTYSFTAEELVELVELDPCSSKYTTVDKILEMERYLNYKPKDHVCRCSE